MNSALPFALIIGIDHFAAKKLAEELSNKDINVVGVGEYVPGLSEIKNCEWLMDLSEVSGKFNYVFDFRGDEDLWQMEQFKGEKITVICVNEKVRAEQIKNDLDKLNLNWRFVEAEGVYGPGMEENNFLVEAIKMAVKNQNLVLPEIKNKFRILAVDDLVEAILRASFLSGTEREKFLVVGKEIDSQEVAKVLIDEAKMTRYKVSQREMEFRKPEMERVEESKRKLRWEPRVEFKEGIVETLRYFFSRVDEENRKKKVKPIPNPSLDRAGQEFVFEKEAVRQDDRLKKRELEVVVEDPPVASQPERTGEILEEIENFYKKKKEELKVESVEEKAIEKLVEPQIETEEIFDQDFEDEIIKTDFKLPMAKKIEDEIKTVEEKKTDDLPKKQDKKIKKEKKWWSWLWLFLAIFIVLVVPINWTISTVLAVKNAKDNLKFLETKKYSKVEDGAEKNLLRLRKIDEDIDSWGLNRIGIVRNYQSLLKIGEDVLKLEKSSVAVSQSADLISQAMFKDRKINFKEELQKEKGYLQIFDSELGITLARLNGDYSWLPEKWRSSLQKQTQNLKEVKEKIALVSKGIEILPEMLGLDGKKKEYLMLFQNEAELRATGGFIGSYGILSFQEGKLLGLEVKDVYEADGQMKGHVEPPVEIKNYLGEANWYMRDANWNPDFVKSAGDVQWFLDKEVSKKVDGVIGIDLAVAKSLLGVVGEIYVPDFKEKINKDNLFDQAEFYSENKFFPGSNQKASFLGTLGRQLFESIKDLKVKQQLDLVMVIMDLLEKNEIQLAFNDQNAAVKAEEMGWSGSIYKGKCAKENCFSDYLMVVESNLGVNKSNYYLDRNMEEVVDISQNSVGRILRINYENRSRENKLPGGDYKNYLRLYLPININLSQITLIDATTGEKKVYTNDEVKIEEKDGKKVIGFLVNVPVVSKKTVEIRYSSENSLTDKNNISYINYVQKQSGFGDTGLRTLVSFPSSWQPLQVEPQASMVGGRLLFNLKLDRDIRMGVELGK